MNTTDIIRVNIDNYNNTNNPQALLMTSTASTTIIENPTDYLVTVEKLEVPIGNKFMPINTDSEPFNICIFSELKLEDGTITNINYGTNWFQFQGPFYSVQDFLDKLNYIIFEQFKGDITMGLFLLEGEDIIYSYNAADAANFDILKIYFDQRLLDFISMPHDLSDYAKNNNTGVETYRFLIDNTTTSSGSKKINQLKKTFHKFFTLKAIRVMSNLGTGSYYINDMATKSMSNSNMLCEIIYNSAQMYDLDNLLYVPNVFRQSSLRHTGSLSSIELSFYYKYANGDNYAVYLDSNEYASITLCFTKKNGNEDILF